MPDAKDNLANVTRGIRLDLAIAVCALLISTVAASASWWQARVLQAQTQVLQEQLGAQVWPYLSVSEGVAGDKVELSTSNDGLGPAIIRSFSADIDGVSQPSVIAIFHAILGPNIVARSRRLHGKRLGFTIDSSAPGAVIRPGDRGPGFSLTSAAFAGPFLKGSRRLNFRLCYCAIIPGKCWVTNSRSPGGATPAPSCPELPHDLLHSSAMDELVRPSF